MMNSKASDIELTIKPFTAEYAELVTSWVRDERELMLLSPMTPPPLTAEKVCKWGTPSNRPFLCVTPDHALPIGYGELNPMKTDPKSVWAGHIILNPDFRRKGLGKRFMRLLFTEAFESLKAEKVALVVFPDNLAAIGCYLRSGMRLIGDEVHTIGPGNATHRMLRFEVVPPLKPMP